VTEILLVTGERLDVDETFEQAEACIIGASRGSMLEFAHLTDSATARTIAVNPAHVVAIRT
jgi:hypothetical protein